MKLFRVCYKNENNIFIERHISSILATIRVYIIYRRMERKKLHSSSNRRQRWCTKINSIIYYCKLYIRLLYPYMGPGRG